jgi:hypothetical protein
LLQRFHGLCTQDFERDFQNKLLVFMQHQNDFTSLTSADWKFEDSISTVADHPALSDTTIVDEPTRLERAELPAEGKLVSTYVPENSISDEVYAFLSAWDEREAERRQNVAGAGRLVEAVKDVDFEPARSLTNRAPPKLFYGTFWRSITRRLIQHNAKHLS